MMLWNIKQLNEYKNYLFHLGSQHEIAYSLIIVGKFINDLLGANTQINITFKQFFFWLRRGGQCLLFPIVLWTLYFVDSTMHILKYAFNFTSFIFT